MKRVDLRIIRVITILVILLSITPLFVNSNVVAYFFMVILLLFALLVGINYRCPYCDKIIDIRVRVNSESHCKRCGRKLM